MCFQLSSNAFSQTNVWVFISESVWALAERIQGSTEHSLFPYRTHASHSCQEPERLFTLPWCLSPTLHKRMSYQPFLFVYRTTFLHATPLTCSSWWFAVLLLGSGILRASFFCIMSSAFNCQFLQMMLLPYQVRHVPETWLTWVHSHGLDPQQLLALSCTCPPFFWRGEVGGVRVCVWLVCLEVIFLFCFLNKFCFNALLRKPYWLACLKQCSSEAWRRKIHS